MERTHIKASQYVHNQGFRHFSCSNGLTEKQTLNKEPQQHQK
jgi:hypothetical protein